MLSEANQNGGPSRGASPERDRAALQEKARQLLQQRLSDPNAPRYSPEEAEAIKERGRKLLQAHQQQLESPSQSPRRNLADGEDEPTFTKTEVDRMKADLIEQFNAHMSQCEEDNQAYWQQTTEHHMQELDAVAAERDAARAQVAALEATVNSNAEAMQRLQSDLAQAQDLARGMEGRCQQLEASNRALLQEVAAAEDAVAALRAESQAAQQAMEQLTCQLDEAKAEAAQLQHELTAAAEARQQAQVLEGMLAQGQDAVRELEGAHAAVQAERDALAAQLAEEKRRSEASALDAQAHQALLADLQRTIADLQRHNAELEERERLAATALATQPSPAAAVPKSEHQNPFNPFISEDVDATHALENDGFAPEQPSALNASERPPAAGAELPNAHQQRDELQALADAAGARASAAEAQLADVEAQLRATVSDLRDAQAEKDLLLQGGDETQRVLEEEQRRRAELEARVAQLEAAAAAAAAVAVHPHVSEEEDLLSSGNGSPKPSHAARKGGANPFATLSEEDPAAAAGFADDDDNAVPMQRVRDLEDRVAELESEKALLQAQVTSVEAALAAKETQEEARPQQGGTPPPTYEDSTAAYEGPLRTTSAPGRPQTSSTNPFANAASGSPSENADESELDMVAPPPPRPMQASNPFVHDDVPIEEDEDEDEDAEVSAPQHTEPFTVSSAAPQQEEALQEAQARIAALEAEDATLVKEREDAMRHADNLEAEVGLLKEELRRVQDGTPAPEPEDDIPVDAVSHQTNPFAPRVASSDAIADGTEDSTAALVEQLRGELDAANRRAAHLEAELALAKTSAPTLASDTPTATSATAPAAEAEEEEEEEEEEVTFAFPNDEEEAAPPAVSEAKPTNPFAALRTPVDQSRRDSYFAEEECAPRPVPAPAPPQPPRRAAAAAAAHNPFLRAAHESDSAEEPVTEEVPMGVAASEDNAWNGLGNPSTRPVSNTDEGSDREETHTATSSSSRAPSTLAEAEVIHVDASAHPLDDYPVEGGPGVYDGAAKVLRAPADKDEEDARNTDHRETVKAALAKVATLTDERDRLQDEVDSLRKQVQVLEAGRAALAKLPDEDTTTKTFTGSFAGDSIGDKMTRVQEVSLRSSSSACLVRERELEKQVEELQMALEAAQSQLEQQHIGERQQPAPGRARSLSQSVLRDELAADAMEPSQSQPSMEEAGRRFADMQLKLRMAKAEIAELRRRLGEPTEEEEDEEDEDEVLPVDAPTTAADAEEAAMTHDTARRGTMSGEEGSAGTAPLGDNEASAANSSPEISASARTERRATTAATHVNPFAVLGEEDGSGSRGPSDMDDVSTDRLSCAAPAEEEEEDREDAEEDEEEEEEVGEPGDSNSTRAAEARPRRTEESTTMQDFGRRYAEAQHKLELAEETRAALEAELAELRERLERQQQPKQPAATVEGAPAPLEEAALAALDREGLLEHIRALEAHIAHMDEEQERELADLAEEAADRVAETEQLYRQRLEDLEAALTAKLQDLDESNHHLTTESLADEEREEEEAVSGEEGDRDDGSAASGRASEGTASTEGPATATDATAELVTALREEISRLKDSLSEAEAAMAHLEEEHETDMRLVAEEIDKQFALRDEQQEAHLAKEAAYESEIAELREAMDALQRQQQQQQHQKQSLLEDVAVDATPDDHHDAEKEELERQLAAAQEDAAQTRDALEKLQARYTQLQGEYDAFLKDTEALRERQLAQQTEDSTTQEARYKAAAAQMDELRRHLGEMEEQMKTAREDVAERDARLRETQQSADADKAALEGRVQTLTEQMQLRDKELEDMSAANEELTELLKQGATSVETALHERQVQLDAALRQLRELNLQLADTKDKLAQREAALEGQKSIEEDLRRQILQLEARSRELEGELREGRKALNEEQRGAAQQSERLSRELERERQGAAAQLAELREAQAKEVAQLQKDLDATRDELQVAQTIAATLPLEGQKYQNQFDALKQQLTEALQSNNELHAELKSAREDLRRQRASLLRSGGNPDEDDGDGAASSDARMNALLQRNELLEGKVRALTEERNSIQQDRDALLLDVRNAQRVAEVKEQAMRRQEGELQHMRAQMSAVRDDLAQRVQNQHTLEQELAHITDHATQMANAYEDLQNTAVDDANRCGLLEEEMALLEAKLLSVPRLVEDVVSGIAGSYTDLVRVSQQERRRLDERCATIESTAMEAMVEGERQTQEYEAALAEARDEQAQLREMIEDMQANLRAAEEALAEAVEQTRASRAEVAETKRRAHEDVFTAQRDRQAAELGHADALNQLSLLEDELATAARAFDKQKARYEDKERELEEETERLRDQLHAMEASAKESRERSGATAAAQAQFVEECATARDEALREAKRLQAQLDRALPRLAQLEEERAARSAELMDTAQRLSALTQKSSTEGEVTRRHLGELNATLQQLTQAHAALQQAHNVSEAAVDRLKNQLAATEQELQRATTKCDQLTRELTTTSSKLKDVETAYARDTGDAQARLRDDERRLKGLEERNAILQEELHVAQDALHKANSELTTTTDSLHHLTEEHRATKAHQGRLIDSLRQRVTELETQLADLQEQECQLRLAHDASQREAHQQEGELSRVRQFLEDANRLNEALNKQLAASKEGHEVELADAQETLAEAQKELARCRKAIADAEAKQLEMEHSIYVLRGEKSKGKEEVTHLRAALEAAQEALQKEQFERQELATLLQNQIAELYEDIRGKQGEIKAQQQTIARLEDSLSMQQRDVEEEKEHARAVKKDLERTRDEMSVLKELHRRERGQLQAELTDAQDAEDEAKRALAHFKEKTTAKLEVYEVTEQNLRQEIVDLRTDVAQLEDALARTTQGKNTAETQGSRQGQSLRAAEEELRALRAQTAKDMAEIGELKMQLQQRTMELERAKRDANGLVMAERNKNEAARRAACEALEAALKKERQATSEARAARDRALAALDQRQQEMEQQEADDAAAREELQQLRRDADLLRHYIHSVQMAAGQAAHEVGIPCRSRGGSGAAGAGVEEEEEVDVQQVLDGLLDELHVYTFAANTLELENTQLEELRRAAAMHAEAMRTVSELSGQRGDEDGETATGLDMDVVTPIAKTAPGGSVSPVRVPGQLSGLNLSSNAGPSPSSAAVAAGALQVQHGQGLGSPSNHALVQQVAQASATVGHRLQDHVNTAQELLRALAVALGAENSNRSEGGAGTTGQDAALAAAGLSSRALAAAAPRAKLLVAATIAELHRQVATATRALHRLAEAHHASTSGTYPNASYTSVSAGGGRPSPSTGRGPLLLPLLQDTLRLFRETESFMLRPFNELLLGEPPSFMSAAGSGGDGRGGNTPPPPPAAAAARRPSPAPATSALGTTPTPTGRRHERFMEDDKDPWM